MNPQIQLIFQQAIQAFENKNFESADLKLKIILKVDAKNFPALYILGLVKASQFMYREAADYLARAARIQPNDASLQFNLAKALSDSGNDQDALLHHKKAVTLAPNDPNVWINYGLSTFNLGRYDEAFDCFNKSLNLKPDFAEAWSNMGNTLKELKRYEEALVHFDKSLTLKPDFAEALVNKGLCLHELKKYDEAIAYYDRSLALKPNYAEAWSNLGNTLKELKRYDEALAHYGKSLTLKPNYAEAWSNLGNTLKELKRYDEALAHFDKSLTLKPNYAEAWSNKGVCLYELERYNEALAHYDKSLILKPNFAEAWSNKGISLDKLKRYDEAIAHYNKALSLKPHIDWVPGYLLHANMKICSWLGFAESLEDISKKVEVNEKVVYPFPLLALNDDAFLHKKSSEIYIQSSHPFNPVLEPILKRPQSQKIRVGYFSADFGNHPVSFLTAELYELHEKNKFEIIAFSFGMDDKSPMRLRLSQAFDQFIDVRDISESGIAKLARELKIDIAVDLGGHTADSRTGIFSYRAAPIQTSYIGYLGTMGAEYYDYLLADKTIIPDELQKFYSEKIAYMPSYQVNDRKRTISKRQFTREELGLPETGFVFCCFNNN